MVNILKSVHIRRCMFSGTLSVEVELSFFHVVTVEDVMKYVIYSSDDMKLPDTFTSIQRNTKEGVKQVNRQLQVVFNNM